MDVSAAIKNLEKLVRQLSDSPSKLEIHKEIQSILANLDKYAETADIPIANYREARIRLVHSCDCLCKIQDDGHNESEHKAWAFGAIEKMKGYHCFNLQD